jgi:hypothetical protein
MRLTLYFLDDHAVVFRRVELECESDEDAVSQVMRMNDGQVVEIWKSGVPVSRLERIF